MAQVVEYLLDKRKTLSLTPSFTKNKKDTISKYFLLFFFLFTFFIHLFTCAYIVYFLLLYRRK
jgi:hypothetical protein